MRTVNSKVTRYIDSKNENITTEDAIALYLQQAKPYPELWYESYKSRIVRRNAAAWGDYWDAMSAIASGETDEDEIDWSEFSCPIHQWQYLYCLI